MLSFMFQLRTFVLSNFSSILCSNGELFVLNSFRPTRNIILHYKSLNEIHTVELCFVGLEQLKI